MGNLTQEFEITHTSKESAKGCVSKSSKVAYLFLKELYEEQKDEFTQYLTGSQNDLYKKHSCKPNTTNDYLKNIFNDWYGDVSFKNFIKEKYKLDVTENSTSGVCNFSYSTETNDCYSGENLQTKLKLAADKALFPHVVNELILLPLTYNHLVMYDFPRDMKKEDANTLRAGLAVASAYAFEKAWLDIKEKFQIYETTTLQPSPDLFKKYFINITLTNIKVPKNEEISHGYPSIYVETSLEKNEALYNFIIDNKEQVQTLTNLFNDKAKKYFIDFIADKIEITNNTATASTETLNELRTQLTNIQQTEFGKDLEYMQIDTPPNTLITFFQRFFFKNPTTDKCKNNITYP